MYEYKYQQDLGMIEKVTNELLLGKVLRRRLLMIGTVFVPYKNTVITHWSEEWSTRPTQINLFLLSSLFRPRSAISLALVS